ncbi:uncharacterized protein N7484_003579 [Penicillium longicatenatum]|uniref:uncharacterized protein n=1 Tax=Penicillium longicatenatum TaxID=1561947 RepID=UPI002548AF93|nr:uncharacterized protein N7484_003579 [Penicillium longicatenatum]KAJ5649856.1 hypothetical protein N7484_003579 [Penicillium longicatenatum]
MSSFSTYQQSGVERAYYLDGVWSPNPPTAMSRLTLQHLQHQGWSVSREAIRLPRRYHSRVDRVRIPLNGPFYSTEIVRTDVYGEWKGVIGPGMVIIETVYRTGRTNLPYSSQLTKAAYEACSPLAGLRYVFMENVVNDDTLEFVRNFIYTEPEYITLETISEAKRKSFQMGTPQYYGLLGTEMGRIVTYLLLDSFRPGYRRIGKITTWFERYNLQLRFDVV